MFCRARYSRFWAVWGRYRWNCDWCPGGCDHHRLLFLLQEETNRVSLNYLSLHCRGLEQLIFAFVCTGVSHKSSRRNVPGSKQAEHLLHNVDYHRKLTLLCVRVTKVHVTFKSKTHIFAKAHS